jgi:TPP-dependent trihydroxycyclohexane-1,2-dione (THcHDO) dehydratase
MAGGAGALSFFGGKAGEETVEIATEVVEESFAVMGKGIVMGIGGALRAVREAVKDNGVEVTAGMTVMVISVFFWRTYVSPRVL